MTRAILYLIAFVLVIGVARSVLGIIAKGFSDIFGSASSSGPAEPNPRSAPLPRAEELKRDPVCGVFIAPSAAIQKTVSGQVYYFCSATCRDKFRG